MANPSALLGLCAKVPRERAQPALERLLSAGAVDSRRAVTERDGHVLVPLSHAGKARDELSDPIVEEPLPPNPRRPPLVRIRERLRGTLVDRELAALPDGYTRLGDVVLVRLPDQLAPHGSAIGRAYGRVLDARAVLHVEATRGELREPATEHLWGDEETETVHREHGIAYRLDPSKVLFSPGNHHERHRLAGEIDPGEHVVDLFAGVGYFTLPIARAGARVTACELNPAAADYLDRNLAANGLADRVEVRRGDCREVAPQGVAGRVLMGYFPGTSRSLGCALGALEPGGGTIHYHTVATGPEPIDAAWGEIAGHPALAGASPRLLSSRRVKTTGPGRTHVVLDVEVAP